MDADRFDFLTRTLTAHPTRRAILRLLAGGTLAAGLARLGWTEAKDKRRKNKKRKKPPCGAAGARCCKGRKCAQGAVCNEVGYCKCALGRRNCAGACIPKDDCCVEGKRLHHLTIYRECGLCQNGQLTVYHEYCPDCLDCKQGTFACGIGPARDGQACGSPTAACGTCRGGQCDTTEASNPCIGRPFLSCCAPGFDCCNGQCYQPCASGRDPATCECLCGGQVCGNGETCVDGLCRSERCPAPDWYVCGATCCVPGYVCCADQPFCCNPGLRCNPTGGCRR